MNNSYVVDEQYIADKGLNLEDYLTDSTYINAVINIGFDLLIDRMCEIGNQFHSEKQIENYLSVSDDERTSEEKIEAFKKAQFKIIYNLVFTAETNPVDQYVDSILVFQLGCVMHGFQKGYTYGIGK